MTKGIQINFRAERKPSQITGDPGLGLRSTDGRSIVPVWEQVGRDGISRFYGPGPAYVRLLKPGEKLENVNTTAEPPPAPPPKNAPKKGKTGKAPEVKQAKVAVGEMARMKGAAGLEDNAATHSAFDYKAWVTKTSQVPFAQVAAAIMQDFDEEVADEPAAVRILIDNALVTADEVIVV